MDLVDEEEDPSITLFDLVEHRLQALLELTAILGAGEKGAHVEREDRAVFEPLGHVAAHDSLRQTFDDGRLADARLANQDRVVLGLSRQDPHHVANLDVAADHRIELARPGLCDEIDTILLECFVGALGRGAGHSLRASNSLESAEECVALDT